MKWSFEKSEFNLEDKAGKFVDNLDVKFSEGTTEIIKLAYIAGAQELSKFLSGLGTIRIIAERGEYS